ncbi:MAG: hypothetical protein ABIJ48_11410 [Actinomycetota bacterium]
MWLVVALVAGAGLGCGGKPAAGSGTPADEPGTAVGSTIPGLRREVRTDAVATDFVGVWTGTTFDKPGEGTSTDTLVIAIPEPPAQGAWEVVLTGTFCEGGEQRVDNPIVEEGVLIFLTLARDGEMVVRLGIDAQDARVVVGESLPAPGNDWGDPRDLELNLTG